MFARDSYLTMPSPSISRVLIYTAAIGGITLFWADLTKKAYGTMALLVNEMFADKGAQDRERRRKIEQEVRDAIELEQIVAESVAPRGENFAGRSPAGKTD